jgi:hypothetical protein
MPMKLVFRLIIGEIVERLHHQRLEDHDFIPRFASRRALAFRFAPAKLAAPPSTREIRFSGKPLPSATLSDATRRSSHTQDNVGITVSFSIFLRRANATSLMSNA